MSLYDQISKDLVLAMKNKEVVKLSTLRLLRSALKNRAIEMKTDRLSDEEVLSTIQKLAKKQHDSIDAFKKGNREDLVRKEKSELIVLQAYLPQQLGRDEIAKVARGVIEKMGVQGPQSMGLVMKEVMAQLKGRAGGKEVSEVVNAELKQT